MKQYDLSILIPARNEEFLKRTVDGILANKRGKTEIIINLDGNWPDPPIEDHPDITIVYNKEPLGQRAGTNQIARLSRAKYVMKSDAHLAFDEGFDVKMMAEMQDNWTMVPRLYNLHVFDWVCNKCQKRWYQSPTPTFCRKEYDDKFKERNPACDNTTDFTRDIIWKPRLHKKTDFMRFDRDLHFQYWGAYKERPESAPDVAPIMSLLGACWMITREKYWELNICDEEHGSWGQQGTEVACKTWLSGGQLMVNKKTWYSHMFRTQGGDFGFPYPISSAQTAHAREHSKKLWLDNTWDKQIYPLSWMIEKFWPIPGWDEADLEKLKKKGEEFYLYRSKGVKEITGVRIKETSKPTKGIIYYTDNALNMKIARACRKQIKKIGLPIVSASLKELHFGEVSLWKIFMLQGLERGYEAYFKQILSCLEASTADIIYFTEHDWLYHPSHFQFVPPRKDTFYYNWNWWRVKFSDGHAVHYDTQLLPGLVAYRELLLIHYREMVAHLKKVGFTAENANRAGFEPGTSKRVQFGSGNKVERFDSDFPNIDIRHDNNLTASKWSVDAFRSPKNAQGWVETEEIPGWGRVKGRFDDFIASI